MFGHLTIRSGRLVGFKIPSGKRLHNYGKPPFSMGTSTISMAIFNSFLYVYQRVYPINIPLNHYKIPLNPIKPL